MKITLSWLREFVKHDFAIRELAERLTMAGLEVESVEIIERRFQGVVVGEILSVEKIPKSDKLSLSKVNVGVETLSIVCGAPNVREGLTVPVAKIGAVLPGNLQIKKAALRGVESEGMICSEKELGLSGDHSGIMILDKVRFKPGDAFMDGSDGEDALFEINVTPNRPDCLSVQGIAREVGVLNGKSVQVPSADEMTPLQSERLPVTIRILDETACPRYSAQLVAGVRIGPSPDWLRKRLESVGMNSINNVVDVTNYVMMETGQPLHAFDFDLLEGGVIVVRKAGSSDTFFTLDGQERNLAQDDLLICDAKKTVALAGVMGGRNSEVSEKTTRILLESAYFDPMTIRKTAKRLGISSEACQRFERGTDPNNTIGALKRSVQLIIETAGGTVLTGILDAYPKPVSPRRIPLRLKRLNKVLGMDFLETDIRRILTGLGCQIEGEDPIQVSAPTYRPDLKAEIDLIEEVIRHFGYDKIELKTSSLQPMEIQPNKEQEFVETVRDIFSGMGFLEAWNVSFVPEKHVNRFSRDTVPVGVRNPLNPETAFLRTALLPGLLENVRWNQNRSSTDLRMFEIGRAFYAKAGSLTNESLRVAGVLTESSKTKGYWRGKSPKTDFYSLKGVLQSFFERLHVSNAVFLSNPAPGWLSETAQILTVQGKTIGTGGEIDPLLLKDFDVSEQVFGFELNMDFLMEAIPETRHYEPIPKFPPVRRDMAVVVGDTVPAGAVLKTIGQSGGDLLHSIELFDQFKGRQIPEGKKSLAFALSFLSSERTLKEEEIDPVFEQIVQALMHQFSASLRTQ